MLFYSMAHMDTYGVLLFMMKLPQTDCCSANTAIVKTMGWYTMRLCECVLDNGVISRCSGAYLVSLKVCLSVCALESMTVHECSFYVGKNLFLYQKM